MDSEPTPRQLREALEYAENIVATIREPLLVLDAGLKIITANQTFYRLFSTTPLETEGKLIYEINNGQWNIPKLRDLLEEILPKNTSFDNFEVEHDFLHLGHRIMILNARRIHDGSPGSNKILLAIEDVTERHQMEYKLSNSELRYRRLFETAQDGILIVNQASGEIVDVNPFLTNLLGYSKTELINKKLWEIGFFRDAAANREAFRNLQEKGYVRYEDLPLETKDGRPLEVEFVSNVYLIDGEKIIQCNIRDITERKKSFEAMVRSEKLYHSLFDNMMDGYAYCQMLFADGSPQDFIYLSVNRAFETLTGLKDVTGKRVSEVIPGLKESNPELFRVYSRVALTGSTERLELYIEQLARWFSISVYSPEKGYFVAVFDNITSRKQAEKSLKQSEQLLRESEQRLHLAQSAANAGTWEWDLRTNANYWSKEIWTLYGLAPESCEPSYETWKLTIHPDDRPGVEKAVQEAVNNGTRLSAEWRVNGQSSRERWLMSVGQPVTEDSGKVTRYIGIVIDITERKKIENLKDGFIGMVSHELKTPLTVVMGSVYTAISQGIPKRQERQLLGDAISAAESLANIIENLLDLSRSQANRLKINKDRFNIAELAANVANKLKSRSKTHKLIVKIPSRLAMIKADRVRIERVLHNLIENSIKYSPQGGEVVIYAKHENNSLIIGIKDSGIGIAKEDQAKLFMPFERLQTADNIGGVGLGLNVCRILVEAHGGHIWVESQPGQGSTFFFALPLDGDK